MKTHYLVLGCLLATAFTVSVLSENIQADLSKNTTDLPQVQPAPKEINQVVASKTSHPVSTGKTASAPPAKCVFKTAFEGEGINKKENELIKIPGKVLASMDEGLAWMKEAQLNDGGWGAGSHGRQGEMDPHSVQSDPATTAMVAMALQRTGNTIYAGLYSKNLKKALYYLLDAVENSSPQDLNITQLTGTQPQSKLGQNIDVVLASQFLTNILPDLEEDQQLYSRVKKAIRKCVSKIENGQSANGSQKGNGWAGVLQSSFATSALETAQSQGVEVDEEVLDKARDFQKGNINPTTNDVTTESAAGIVLYSVSGSARATAKETREAKQHIEKAKREGKIKDEKVNVDNLKKAGLSEAQAMKYSTAYNINKSAQKLANDDNVMSGFGNNGGEEFLSYLQTGEGMIVSNDQQWKTWYDKMSNRLLNIQNNDGSWSGHHCITSPVFCTATCLLILSVSNDIDKLREN